VRARAKKKLTAKKRYRREKDVSRKTWSSLYQLKGTTKLIGGIMKRETKTYARKKTRAVNFTFHSKSGSAAAASRMFLFPFS
jgi:hypothetical protein